MADASTTRDDRQRTERVAASGRSLEAAARQAGMVVTGDGRVSENAAGELLGLAPGTLRNWRSERDGPPSYQIGVGSGSRVSYRLAELAEWLESRREL